LIEVYLKHSEAEQKAPYSIFVAFLAVIAEVQFCSSGLKLSIQAPTISAFLHRAVVLRQSTRQYISTRGHFGFSADGCLAHCSISGWTRVPGDYV
jgi:hypothetical protein